MLVKGKPDIFGLQIRILPWSLVFRPRGEPRLGIRVCRKNWSVCSMNHMTCLWVIMSPADGQGNEKLVYRLIRLFSSTEIFSKRRKIYAYWRKSRVNSPAEKSVICWTWSRKVCGTADNSKDTVHYTRMCRRVRAIATVVTRFKMTLRVTEALGSHYGLPSLSKPARAFHAEWRWKTSARTKSWLVSHEFALTKD